MWACEKNHIAVVDSLLECGAHVDDVDVCIHSRADLEFMSLLLLCSSVMNGQASSCQVEKATWRS